MNAIEPYRGDAAGGKVVQFVNDGVAADVRIERVDRRTGAMWYAIRLASGRSQLTGRLLVADPWGTTVECGSVEVESGSIGSSSLCVPPLPKKWANADVFLELRSDTMLLRVPAPGPPRRRRPVALQIGAAVFALGAVAAASGGLALAIPDTPTILAPSHAIAGEVARLAYTTHGVNSLHYLATIGGGTVLAAGDLHDARGEITFALPLSSAHQEISVLLSGGGLLGATAHSTSFSVAAPEPARIVSASVARVAAFSARRERFGSGESILASFLAVADSGELRVTDRNDRTVARAPFSRRGTERIAIPTGLETEPLSVTLEIHRGATRASATILTQPVVDVASLTMAQPQAPALQAPPASAGAAQSSPDDVPEAVVPADTTGSGDEPFTVTGAPIAGQPIIVRVNRFVAGMHLRLSDGSGLVIDDVAVDATMRTAHLRTPAGTTEQTYYLTCSYGSGAGEEVLVRSVRVAAR